MKISRQKTVVVIWLSLIICATGNTTFAQKDIEVAGRFAPVFYQALGDRPRSDYITNFDFDGDWVGDNNWNNAVNETFPLKAFIYFSVAETSTHFFIHYAVFHPRDYKGGEVRGTLLSELIRQGAKHGAKYDPTGLADEATLAHENDMEGALVVVKRDGNNLDHAQVVFVETLRHNTFPRYQTGEAVPGVPAVTLEGQRPLLYIEPKGHGIEAFTNNPKQTSRKSFLRYVYGEHAGDSEKVNVCRDVDITPCKSSVAYELIPLGTLWAKAKGDENPTYGVTFDYGEVTISTRLNDAGTVEKKVSVGKMGCAFRGGVGGINMARPPWGWFDRESPNQALGSWFFDPAVRIKSDFSLDSNFSTSYVKLPFWAN